MTVHHLKCWLDEFAAHQRGLKHHEFRREDGRGFETGDVLVLQEYDEQIGEYVHRNISKRVTHLTRGPAFGIPEGYVVMSVRPLSEPMP